MTTKIETKTKQGLPRLPSEQQMNIASGKILSHWIENKNMAIRKDLIDLIERGMYWMYETLLQELIDRDKELLDKKNAHTNTTKTK